MLPLPNNCNCDLKCQGPKTITKASKYEEHHVFSTLGGTVTKMSVTAW